MMLLFSLVLVVVPDFVFSVTIKDDVRYWKKVAQLQYHPNRDPIENIISVRKPLDCPLEKPDIDECYYYGRFPCEHDFLESFKAESAKRPGLIVSGQGGSATRAAQEVVQKVGSHDFGMLSNSSLDSLAARYSYLWSGDREVIALTRNATYDSKLLGDTDEGMISKNKPEQVCRTFRLLDDMIRRKHENVTGKHVAEGSYKDLKPWAMKSPYLRMLLPFLDQTIGTHAYLFVHVTRDVHHIHDMHTDDKVFDLIRDNFNAKQNFWDDIKTVFNNWDRPNRMDTPTVQDAGGDPFDKQVMEDLMVEVASAATRIYANETEQENFVQRAKFAYVWGNIELGLMRAWKKERPGQYFHLSERQMLTDGKHTATKLANFLGVSSPSEFLIADMQNVYQPEPPDKAHYDMMRKISSLKCMGSVRDALDAFGYDQYSHNGAVKKEIEEEVEKDEEEVDDSVKKVEKEAEDVVEEHISKKTKAAKHTHVKEGKKNSSAKERREKRHAKAAVAHGHSHAAKAISAISARAKPVNEKSIREKPVIRKPTQHRHAHQ